MAWNGLRWFSWPLRLAALLHFASLGSVGLAADHPNDRFSCENPQRAEELHRTFPDNVNAEINYAICQVLKGDRAEGLRRLHHVTDKHNYVFSAYFLAEYKQIDREELDDAIDAYFKVLLLIDLTPYYPKGFELYEYEAQIELQSHYRVPRLYLERFITGAVGLYHEHLIDSPTYEGDKDIRTYPQFSPYTLHSLQKTIEHAQRCIDIPKKSYFRQPHYDDIMEGCQLLKNTAETLLPLEENRLRLLASTSCNRDVLECIEHQELLKGKILPIYKSADSNLKKHFAHYYQEQQDSRETASDNN